ncbi:MAG TPA: class I SAM-dependent methyltransferase [Thermoplasmata archaeon]|nr:class I SAM-dependent methyltransferase [Thermoplasmata archaeon]
MDGAQVVADFDEIAQQYDATREPLAPTALETIRTTFSDWGVRRLLEVGVGTGRVAEPLARSGLLVTGVDASGGMLARARAKRLDRLVRGSAYRLPFADRSFDLALFVHVLHLLDRPEEAIAQARRVSRVGVAGLLRPRTGDGTAREAGPRPRALVLERLRAMGIDVPERASGGPPVRERELLERSPPDRLVPVLEEDVTEPLADELRLFAARASRWTLRVPPEAMARAVAEVRAELGDRTRTYRRRIALALWERPPAPPPEAR